MLLPIGGLVAAIVLAVWLWPDSGPAEIPRPPARARTTAAAAEAALSPRRLGALAAASTASLRCADTFGSGFFVAPDQLVTNAHVLCEDSTSIQVVMSDGRELTGAAERSDRWLDLALVRVAGADEPALALDDASSLRQGDELFFYGSPRGLDFTLSRAMVSHQSRSIEGIAYVQLDGNVNPGNSGGPLLSPAGKVIGIVTAMVGEASGLGLALPVNYLYEGESAFLASPPGADHVAWKRLVGEVEADDARDADEARLTLSRPVLVSVQPNGGGGALVAVARGSSFRPMGEQLHFQVERQGGVICMPTGEVLDWRPAGRGDVTDEHSRQWLERHHLDTDVWMAMARLEWEGCPEPGLTAGDVLLLLGGAPSADRLTIARPQPFGFVPP